jgi:hypothetical protein
MLEALSIVLSCVKILLDDSVNFLIFAAYPLAGYLVGYSEFVFLVLV